MGFWQRCEKAFFAVRVLNPYASTHQRQTLNSSFNANEREKKRQYNQRIIEVEHGSFTPVVLAVEERYNISSPSWQKSLL